LFFGGLFDYDKKFERLHNVLQELADPKVWNDPLRAQNLSKERVQLESVVKNLDELNNSIQDNRDLLELAVLEDDEKAAADIAQDVEKIGAILADMEFRRMFSNPMDKSNAYVDIQSGAGGTEAQDVCICAGATKMALKFN